jgi:hypothetical protein
MTKARTKKTTGIVRQHGNTTHGMTKTPTFRSWQGMVQRYGTRRVYHVPVHPELRPLLPDGELGAPQKPTALNAVASTYGLTGKEYVLEVET